MKTISINEIEQTNAWKNLNPIQRQFAVKRQNRLLIQNALIVHKNSGVIPGNVFGYNLSITKEIIGESVKFD